VRKGAFELGFKEIVIAVLAVVIIIMVALILIRLISPAVETGSVFGRETLGNI
jgi:hypothetical protein